MTRRGRVAIKASAHLLATGAALYYAWLISQSGYVKTGLQFITPLLVIMAVHLVWIACAQGLSRGFSQLVFRRSAQSAVGLACAIFLFSIIAPMPAVAAGDHIWEGLLVFAICVTIVAAVVGIAGFVIYKTYKLIATLARRRGGSDDTDTRLFDVASIAVAALVLGAASLEGVPNAYSFVTRGQATASHVTEQTPARVWQVLERATSPAFPLPEVLRLFPQPVDVVIDEGTAPGSMRKVKFSGREGTGYLTLVVVERTDRVLAFEVVSDTSPIANWVAHRKLIYTVTPLDAGTRIGVTLEYDRLLAPAWFFGAFVKGTAYLAMDVLARDVKSRADAAGAQL